jgi:hypothetical protein
MSERPRSPEVNSPERETIEQKKERLGPTLERSLDVFRNPEKPLREGALIVIRRGENGEETAVSGLVAMEIRDEDVEFGAIEDDGEIGASGFMGWDEVIDAKEDGGQ